MKGRSGLLEERSREKGMRFVGDGESIPGVDRTGGFISTEGISDEGTIPTDAAC